jgi:hypothetical protein
MDKYPDSIRKPRIKRPARDVPTLRVENEIGGPTSLPGLCVEGIARVVRIAHNHMAGRLPEAGLDELPPQKPTRENT